jgi:hypothetical protein
MSIAVGMLGGYLETIKGKHMYGIGEDGKA